MKKVLILFLFLCLPVWLMAQENKNKILHADPVYDDLTGDLGALRGDNEINLNFGYHKLDGFHHTLLSQLEMEYTPVNKLSFELLIPYTAYFTNPVLDDQRPENSLEFLQWTSQYTFYQSFERKISLAVGFSNAFQSQDPYVSPEEDSKGFSVENIQYQPFLIVAKNWQDKYFILFNGSLEFDHDLEENTIVIAPMLTSAFHYKFSEENDHFLGIELNKVVEDGDFKMILRPQVKLEITDSFNIGTAVGIPVPNTETKWSAFIRIAYEI